MSIEEFHSQLSETDPTDALMAALGRLALADDSGITEPLEMADGWGPGGAAGW